MDELSSAERKKLRGLAQRLKPSIHVGRSGVTSTVVEETRRALHRDELIKIRVHASDRESRAALIDQLVRETGSTLCGTVGQTASIFRQREES